MTLADYDAMLAAQGGVCTICESPPTVVARAKGLTRGGGDERFMQIDHDHETGAVRGLLCLTCNRALGNLHDDPDLCEAAAAYLRAHQATDEPAPQRAQGA
jgi:Recombination endonuclease VII